MSLDDYRTQIEETLELLVPKPDGTTFTLMQAVRHALYGGGKRLRPLLTLTTTAALNGTIEHALQPACALEMIHTYSLIHDDLPCMDDDTMRRGRPTVHCAFDEAHAVLAGDYLLTHAFEVIVKAPHLNDTQKVALTKALAKGAGGHGGMIAGQAMDVEAEGKKVSLETLKAIHLSKTGALIATAIEFGAIITHAPIEPLRIFGESIGLAYQVVDDILDVTAPEQKHGHASDAANEKTTYVSLIGLEEAQNVADNLLSRAMSALKPLPFNTETLSTLASQLVHRKI